MNRFLLTIRAALTLPNAVKVNDQVDNWFDNELRNIYIIPSEPAMKPIKTKKENSARSLGREFTIRFS